MPPKTGSSSSAAKEAPTEEWEPGAASFFGDFEAGDGPSKRKNGRSLARREERTGKSLEEEAMDPVVSAAEAKKKIANLVRLRAGLKPLSSGSDSPSNDETQPVHVSKKARVEAKFERKEQRREDAATDAKKYRRLNAKMAVQQRFKRR
ncbi:Hypothetical protein, putative [Bodo saltans]|uniref:Uncharacterized protein n=1 Tax=Bodo saltans TaxID=75058 RepID=A0A0S4JM38_BODSA|nr:Hypothetical protein, putative [Bodo saltans]|eukprot:CUG89561.1 Hypothetical protein, putative [Bodo saltans]